MKQLLSLLSLSALTIAPAYAQEEAEEYEEHLPSLLPPPPLTIVVTGLRPPLGDNALEVVAIKLDERQPERVENLLRDIPGLQQFRRSDARSANPTSQGVTLRGLGGNASSRLLITLDDVPQADPFGGWVSWPGYDALALRSARLVKGGGSVTAGAGAIAGQLELVSNDINSGLYDPEEEFDARLQYGSFNSVDGKAVLKRSLGVGHVTLSGSYAQSDGFVPILAAQRGAIDRGASYRQFGGAVRAILPLNNSLEMQANLRGFSDRRDRGFDFSESQNDGVDASVRLVSEASDWRWSMLAYLQMRGFNNRFGAVANDRNSVSLTLDQFNVPSTGWGAKFELRPPSNDGIELRLGADLRAVSGETRENSNFIAGTPQRSRRAGGSSTILGLFGDASLELNPVVIVTLGGRVDSWNINNGFRLETELAAPLAGAVRSNDIFADRSGHEISGRLGFKWDALTGLNLRGAVYSGWRLPTLNELYRPFRVGANATAANELLSPENVKGVELGLNADVYATDKFGLDLSLTAFHNRLDNAVANVTLGRGPGLFPGVGFVSAAGIYQQRQNLPSIRSQGVEASADFNLDFLIDRLNLTTSYSYVDAAVRGAGPSLFLDGLRPAQVPKHSAFASLDWSNITVQWVAGIKLRYTGRQYEDDLNTQKLRAALTLDGFLRWEPIQNKLGFEFRAENLFNARVEAANSNGIIERASPRSIWLGVHFAIP
ncbi:TonB-dependent receptor [Sphingorhabdus sp.]|uniref:TonB-dependent receptor n=1 Tax=Sphingorhabdus sp. TaxID=1902408 RepID=UPI0032B7BE39